MLEREMHRCGEPRGEGDGDRLGNSDRTLTASRVRVAYFEMAWVRAALSGILKRVRRTIWGMVGDISFRKDGEMKD
jgi:hypothetical protein